MCESSLTSAIIQMKTKTFSLTVIVSEKKHGPRSVLEQRTVKRREVNH